MGLAIVARQPGGPEMLTAVNLTESRPGPGQAALRHTAIGVNFIDTYFRSGLYPWPVENDLLLGAEAAGVVEEVGEGVIEFTPGQRVAYTLPHGAYTTRRVVDARHLVPLPDSVSNEAAAASMLKGLTAYYLLHHSYQVSEGDTVLFHAAAGGVGLLAGQWLAHKGVRAIGTAGGPEKCALARAHGYADVIDYKAEDFAERVRELTGDAGVAAVYDSVGADTFAGSLASLAPFGTLVNFGQSSGPVTGFQVSDLSAGSYTLTRPVLFHFTTSRAWLTGAARELFALIADGVLKVEVNQRYPLADAAEAHRALEARATTGSTILVP
ncbi:MAG TPA: quinone oxidoreductase [Rhodobacterales bacterium]|nr:quinone oxidoreductase [Rhodobacterales bacterium]